MAITERIDINKSPLDLANIGKERLQVTASPVSAFVQPVVEQKESGARKLAEVLGIGQKMLGRYQEREIFDAKKAEQKRLSDIKAKKELYKQQDKEIGIYTKELAEKVAAGVVTKEQSEEWIDALKTSVEGVRVEEKFSNRLDTIQGQKMGLDFNLNNFEAFKQSNPDLTNTESRNKYKDEYLNNITSDKNLSDEFKLQAVKKINSNFNNIIKNALKLDRDEQKDARFSDLNVISDSISKSEFKDNTEYFDFLDEQRKAFKERGLSNNDFHQSIMDNLLENGTIEELERYKMYGSDGVIPYSTIEGYENKFNKRIESIKNKQSNDLEKRSNREKFLLKKQFYTDDNLNNYKNYTEAEKDLEKRSSEINYKLTETDYNKLYDTYEEKQFKDNAEKEFDKYDAMGLSVEEISEVITDSKSLKYIKERSIKLQNKRLLEYEQSGDSSDLLNQIKRNGTTKIVDGYLNRNLEFNKDVNQMSDEELQKKIDTFELYQESINNNINITSSKDQENKLFFGSSLLKFNTELDNKEKLEIISRYTNLTQNDLNNGRGINKVNRNKLQRKLIELRVDAKTQGFIKDYANRYARVNGIPFSPEMRSELLDANKKYIEINGSRLDITKSGFEDSDVKEHIEWYIEFRKKSGFKEYDEEGMRFENSHEDINNIIAQTKDGVGFDSFNLEKIRKIRNYMDRKDIIMKSKRDAIENYDKYKLNSIERKISRNKLIIKRLKGKQDVSKFVEDNKQLELEIENYVTKAEKEKQKVEKQKQKEYQDNLKNIPEEWKDDKGIFNFPKTIK